jgi:hypothetical protein
MSDVLQPVNGGLVRVYIGQLFRRHADRKHPE